jgi:hypothetical protein
MVVPDTLGDPLHRGYINVFLKDYHAYSCRH